jgi:hypothetical protein
MSGNKANLKLEHQGVPAIDARWSLGVTKPL